MRPSRGRGTRGLPWRCSPSPSKGRLAAQTWCHNRARFPASWQQMEPHRRVVAIGIGRPLRSTWRIEGSSGGANLVPQPGAIPGIVAANGASPTGGRHRERPAIEEYMAHRRVDQVCAAGRPFDAPCTPQWPASPDGDHPSVRLHFLPRCQEAHPVVAPSLHRRTALRCAMYYSMAGLSRWRPPVGEAPFAATMPGSAPGCGTKFAPPDDPSMRHVLLNGRPLPMATTRR